MTDTIICKKCGEECDIDGEFPKFCAWCETCNDYAEGDGVKDYTEDWFASKIDALHERSRL